MYNSWLSVFDNPWVGWILTAIYVLSIIITIGVILAENRNPVKSLAWVTVLVFFPAVGVVLYIFFGRSIKNTRMISRRNRRRLKRQLHSRPVDLNKLDFSRETIHEARLAHSLTSAGFFPDNAVTVFTNGTSKFAALEKDLREARSFINIQYYIFADDKIGTRIRDILIERARAGVKVRVIYDHVGSMHTSSRFFRRMKEAGIEVYPFFRVTFRVLGTRINWRNHRKLCVIDGRVGYIGGMNIADRYIDGGRHFNEWRDTHLRVVGPAVAVLQGSFAIDWNFMGRPLIADPLPEWDPEHTPGHVGIQLVTSGPTSQWSNVEFMFHKAIASAKRRIFIQTPYFLPTEGLLKALQTAALSGVDVRIMLPRRSDSAMLRYASFSFITECLRAGIKIYLFEPGMLHAKNIVIDDELSSVGSTNFDFRSFEHNFEANMFLYSKEFNRRLADIFLADQRRSRRVLPAVWYRRPRAHKAAESILRLLSPIL